jgi:predicted transposase/invertase (TIGR01784 family)
MIFLNPTNDVAFKKLFGIQSQKEVLINFLNNILERVDGEKITHITYNDPYNHPETQSSKLSIVDVSATDQSGKNYIIEVQVDSQQDYDARAQYYSALAVARQLDQAEEYAKLTPVIFVGILDFNRFKNQNYLSHHLVFDKETKTNKLRLMEWHFIELKKFKKELGHLESVADKWIYLLKNASKFKAIPEELKNPLALKQALETLNKAMWSDQELYEYDKKRDEVISEKSKLSTAKAEGLAEGLVQGEQQKAIAIAQTMLAENIDSNAITRFTGLSLEDINELKKK